MKVEKITNSICFSCKAVCTIADREKENCPLYKPDYNCGKPLKKECEHVFNDNICIKCGYDQGFCKCPEEVNKGRSKVGCSNQIVMFTQVCWKCLKTFSPESLKKVGIEFNELAFSKMPTWEQTLYIKDIILKIISVINKQP